MGRRLGHLVNESSPRHGARRVYAEQAVGVRRSSSHQSHARRCRGTYANQGVPTIQIW